MAGDFGFGPPTLLTRLAEEPRRGGKNLAKGEALGLGGIEESPEGAKEWMCRPFRAEVFRPVGAGQRWLARLIDEEVDAGKDECGKTD